MVKKNSLYEEPEDPLEGIKFGYVKLELCTDGPDEITLDHIRVRAYCNAALSQFLGLTGLAIPVDTLKTTSDESWLRVPREDLSRFTAALTAYRGTKIEDTMCLLRIEQTGNSLSTIKGTQDIDESLDNRP